MRHFYTLSLRQNYAFLLIEIKCYENLGFELWFLGSRLNCGFKVLRVLKDLKDSQL